MVVKTLVNKLGRLEVKRADKKESQRIELATRTASDTISSWPTNPRLRQECSPLNNLPLEVRICIYNVLLDEVIKRVHIKPFESDEPVYCETCHRDFIAVRPRYTTNDERLQGNAERTMTSRPRSRDLLSLMLSCAQLYDHPNLKHQPITDFQ